MRVVVIYQSYPRVARTGELRIEPGRFGGPRNYFVDPNVNRTKASWNRARYTMQPVWPEDIWPEENAAKVIELMKKQNSELIEVTSRHHFARLALKGAIEGDK